jgi:hypothetical protein
MCTFPLPLRRLAETRNGTRGGLGIIQTLLELMGSEMTHILYDATPLLDDMDD